MSSPVELEHPPQGFVGLWCYNQTDKKWYPLSADSDGHLALYISGQDTDIEVTQTTPADLAVAQHQYDGSAWRKSNLIFGYNDRWVFAATGTSVGGADTEAQTTVVAEGYVHIVTGLAVYHNDPIARIVNIALDVAGADYYFTTLGSVPSATWTPIVVDVLLKENDRLTAHFVALANTKVGQFRGVGYKMKVNM